MPFTPADPTNRALSALGLTDKVIGSIEDGTRESEAARRVYGQLLRALLRTAHWSFARKRAELELLGDSLGTTLSPQGAPFSTNVEQPWRFAYAWPTDGVQAIWVPWSGAPPSTTPPQMTNVQTFSGPWTHERPARFLSSTSDQFPVLVGQADWANLPDVDDVEGVSYISRRVILTNVPPWFDASSNMHGASLVYTRLTTEIELWDSLFSVAFDAVLAQALAMPLLVDRNATADEQAKQRGAAAQIRNGQIAIAKNAIMQARVASANEAGYPQSTDQIPDWIRARNMGGTWSRGVGGAGWEGDGPGYTWGGWSSFSFGDGSVF